MADVIFQNVQCWENYRLGQVLNKEAASVDRATFLATHTPINNLIDERALKQIIDHSENGLLKELHRCSDENEHAFVIIKGIPGTGKSHLIRWLKERYTIHREHQESIIFIERASCSLRGTLEQIIRSGYFDDTAMQEQLKRLNNASTQLSEATLSETLLDNLRNAACEGDMPKWFARNDRLKKLLLDYTVRKELMKDGGPIDRLTRFLSQGQNASLDTNEIPKFTSNDFFFKVSIREEIKKGYSDAHEIADDLHEKDEKRMELAKYLNQFIGTAIGRTTSLTSDDFKNIFYDLRRYLYQQKRHLALFIEDITVLTGIDTGLIDVLATQHKNSSGIQEFCRLISIIGITDNYYYDSFPENMKDRVTHRIAMSGVHENQTIDLLSDSAKTAEMAARYLNAIRLKEKDIELWANQRANSTHFPNACDPCPVKNACHQAFGSQTISIDDSEPITVGLYPFNSRALWNLYQHISYKKTPRTFLHIVLHYILQSHSSKIKNGQFPPANGDLGGEFETFWLSKPQQNVIAEQGKQNAKRIETLVMIWGNGTIDANQKEQITFVGDLPQEVFKAFNIHLIQGEQIPISSSSPNSSNNSSSSTGLSNLDTNSRPIKVPNDPFLEREHQNRKHIAEWLNNSPLQNYEDYLDLLLPLIRNFVDWDFYDLSSFQVDEVLKGRRRIQLQGQAGRMNTTYFLSFERSPELAIVLQGLFEMKERNLAYNKAAIGGYLTNFSIWLHKHEAEIVQFVRQPNHESKNILPFTTIVVLDCLLLACLSGSLKANYTSSTELYLDLVNFCVATTEESWATNQQEAARLHSHIWSDLVKRIKPQLAANVCSYFKKILNRAQGGSPEIIFLDAAQAIHILDDFRRSNWQLPPLSFIGTTNLKSWEDTISIYRSLQEHFATALQDDQQMLQEKYATLQNFLGESQPKDAIQAIITFVDILTKSSRGTNFNLKRNLSANRLTTVLTELRNILRMQTQSSELLVLRLATINSSIDMSSHFAETLKDFLDYFGDFEKEALKQQKSLQSEHSSLLANFDPEIEVEQTKVTKLYTALIEHLETLKVKEE